MLVTLTLLLLCHPVITSSGQFRRRVIFGMRRPCRTTICWWIPTRKVDHVALVDRVEPFTGGD